MPAEKFYAPDVIEGEQVEFAHGRAFTACWGKPGGTSDDAPHGAIWVAGVPLDRSGTNRLIRTLRRARDTVYGRDE